jgi:hypothetical protein
LVTSETNCKTKEAERQVKAFSSETDFKEQAISQLAQIPPENNQKLMQPFLSESELNMDFNRCYSPDN